MKPKQLVRISNATVIISIVLLVYQVFAFITIEVFGLRVFRENLTRLFYTGTLGVLAIMTGALIINIMVNLTRIAQKHNQDEATDGATDKKGNKTVWALLVGLLILLPMLFGGDYLTSKKREEFLIKSAESIIETNIKKNDHLLRYGFNKEWISKTEEILDILSKIDRDLPAVSILVKESMKGAPVFLGFNRYGNMNDTTMIKRNFIRSTTKPEREYLNSVFDRGNEGYRYSSHNGKYELFYPYSDGKNRIVVYFSEYRRYGKTGI